MKNKEPRRIYFGKIYRFLSGDSWKNTNSAFVLSTGRSGTATLAELLALSPKINAYHEPPPDLLKERQSAFHEISSNPDKYARIFVKTRSGLMAQAKHQKKFYAETSARLTFFAPVISQICPNARFIHLVRHPGAVVRSGMRRKWYEMNGRLDRYRVYPSPDDPFSHKWDTASPFEKICWYWDAYNAFALRFSATIPPERMLLLKAEDLFEGEMETMKKLFEFIQIECPPPNLVDTVLKGKLNRQQSGLFPLFEDWEESEYRKLIPIAGETMFKLGYWDKSGLDKI